MQERKVGFIGLGAMGSGMVKSLLRSGFPVRVYDLRPEARASMVEAGATEAMSPAEVAKDVDVVMSSLPDPKAVNEAVFGQNGFLQSIRSGTFYIDLSSIDPSTTLRVGAALAERGVTMLDVPVGKGPDAAAKGELTLMVGGDPGAVEQLQDVLQAVGKMQIYCGPLGSGVAIKNINNLVSCATNALNAEALVLGAKYGVNLDVLVDVMRSTGADNAHLRNAKRKALAGDFSPTFKLSLAHKDLGLALRMAMELGVPTPLGDIAYQYHSLAMAEGLGQEGQAAYIKVIEKVAGVQARS
ncbi:MAG: NAD(P)-dependent oxidoreductase, partial [Chloroflexota bacterium]